MPAWLALFATARNLSDGRGNILKGIRRPRGVRMDAVRERDGRGISREVAEWIG